MELQWILVVVSIVIIAMIAWHSSNATVSKVLSAIKPSLKRKPKAAPAFELEVQTQHYDDEHEFMDDPYFNNPDPVDEICDEQLGHNDVYVINLRSTNPNGFSGEQLVLQLNRAGLHYGEMDIFHYEENKPQGPERLFSLASAFEPGIFDMDRIEHFKSTGLTMFMQPGMLRNPRVAFETMLEVSERLAAALQAQICDQDWQPLTEESLERYFKRIH